MPRPQAQPSENPSQRSTIDAEEIARFSALAGQWWDENGPFRPLHRMNPTRIAYIRDRVLSRFPQGLAGLRLLDIGCGGGLICEPMARLGAHVTGIDAAEKNIRTAALHAARSGLSIDYRATSAEALAATDERFDVILALEIIEHVADTGAFLEAITHLLTPGGVLIMSTLNRTPRSYAMAIIGAEYILRLLPVGTHEWRKFIRPSELAHALRAHRLVLDDTQGMVMQPLSGSWSLDAHDLRVNYLISSHKPL